jgi:hypothetical protein
MREIKNILIITSLILFFIFLSYSSIHIKNIFNIFMKKPKPVPEPI